MRYYDLNHIFTDAVTIYCENHGIYEVLSRRGNVINYYSYFGKEGFYKISHNIKTGAETRVRLRYSKPPKFLIAENGGTKYNYFAG